MQLSTDNETTLTAIDEVKARGLKITLYPEDDSKTFKIQLTQETFDRNKSRYLNIGQVHPEYVMPTILHVLRAKQPEFPDAFITQLLLWE